MNIRSKLLKNINLNVNFIKQFHEELISELYQANRGILTGL